MKTRKDKKDRLGEKHINNQGYEVEIIKYLGAYSCDVVFPCGFTMHNIQYAKLIKGNIKYPFHPAIYGVGYFGVGEHKADYVYDCWSKMLQRCYSEYSRKRYLTYKDCTVDERWHNFQVFAQWYKDNCVDRSWHLDKDILVRGNKIYSPETCCLVPRYVNSIFVKNDAGRGEYPIGVSRLKKGIRATFTKRGIRVYLGWFKTPEEAFQAYKIAKEAHIKEVADEYKDLIDPRVYKAMYEYKVEITD